MFSPGEPAMESLKILKAGSFRKHKVETVKRTRDCEAEVDRGTPEDLGSDREKPEILEE